MRWRIVFLTDSVKWCHWKLRCVLNSLHFVVFEYASGAIARVFIDGPWLHLWHCHRRPDRSFFVQGRQFHVCARCTGLIGGFSISPLLLFFPSILLPGCIVWVTLMIADGLTQLFRVRKSTNLVRLATGLGYGAFAASQILLLAIHLTRAIYRCRINVYLSLRFPVTAEGQRRKVRSINFLLDCDWKIVGEMIEPGHMKGNEACCLAMICLPLGFAAGRTEDIVTVNLQYEGSDEAAAAHEHKPIELDYAPCYLRCMWRFTN